MLRNALFLAREDLGRMLRVRETLVWIFVMPILFFYFIGTITANIAGPADSRDFLAIHAAAAELLAGPLADRLEAAGYRVDRLPAGEVKGRYVRMLEIPAGFTEKVLAGQTVKFRFSRVQEGLGDELDRARISRVIRGVISDLVILTKESAALTPTAFDDLARKRSALSLDVTMAGKRVRPPTGFDQSVPGTMVMFTMLVLLTVGGVSLVMERSAGILSRLASAPISRGSIVLGKWGARMAMGLVQIAFAMLAGSVLFHVHWGPNVPFAALVLIAYAALVTALGMLLGNFGRTTGIVVGVGVIVTNVLAGLGGCWWPIEVTPLWAQKLAQFVPSGWIMDALHKLINFGASPVVVIPHLAVTVAAALLAGYVVSRKFRFQ